MTGTVISPRSPQDYPNHIYCLWDISVPFGYHVALYFHRFDVQQSDDCSKDYIKVVFKLQISSVDFYPYFMKQDEVLISIVIEVRRFLCEIEIWCLYLRYCLSKIRYDFVIETYSYSKLVFFYLVIIFSIVKIFC